MAYGRLDESKLYYSMAFALTVVIFTFALMELQVAALADDATFELHVVGHSSLFALAKHVAHLIAMIVESELIEGLDQLVML